MPNAGIPDERAEDEESWEGGILGSYADEREVRTIDTGIFEM
jgi:hypothetical protein